MNYKKSMTILILTAISIIINNKYCFGQIDNTESKLFLTKSFYNSGDFTEKLNIYNKIVNLYPPSEKIDSIINYDELKRILALNYLVSGDTTLFQRYISSILDKETLSINLNEVAEHWAKIKPLRSAAGRLSLIALNINDSLYNAQLSSSLSQNIDKKRNNILVSQKITFATTYGSILYHSGKYDEALEVMSPLYKLVKPTDFLFLEYYSLILAKNGYVKRSSRIAKELLLKGYQSKNLEIQINRNYINMYANDNGFKKFAIKLNRKLNKNTIATISKKVLRKKSPEFILKDINGKLVFSKENLGKLIVIDFWATWCTPCLEMFPAMQKVVDTYKDNDKVAFLFINTWETDKNYITLVKQFYIDKGYNFNILFDELDSTEKQQKTSLLFGIKSLPSRIIINQLGEIISIDEGYSGDKEHLINDLIFKIDYLLKKN